MPLTNLPLISSPTSLVALSLSVCGVMRFDPSAFLHIMWKRKSHVVCAINQALLCILGNAAQV